MSTSVKDQVNPEEDVSASSDPSASPAATSSSSSSSSSPSSSSSRSRRSRLSVDANTVYEQQRILNLLQEQHRKQVNQSKRKPEEDEEEQAETAEDAQTAAESDKTHGESGADDSKAPAKKKRKKVQKTNNDEVEITGEKVVNGKAKKTKKQRKTLHEKHEKKEKAAHTMPNANANASHAQSQAQTQAQLEDSGTLSIDLYSEDPIEVPGMNEQERDSNLHRLVRRLMGGLSNFTAVTNAMKWAADSAKARIQEISVANGDAMQETQPSAGADASGAAAAGAHVTPVAESSTAMEEDAPRESKA